MYFGAIPLCNIDGFIKIQAATSPARKVKLAKKFKIEIDV